jgi:hypothetical protein
MLVERDLALGGARLGAVLDATVINEMRQVIDSGHWSRDRIGC